MRSNTATSKTFTPIATYEQIENDLRMRVNRGDWAVGSLIPSRRELAKKYNVDLRTLQRAISALLEEGMLRAEGTRGTSVARVMQLQTNSGLAESFQAIGRENPLVNGRALAVVGVAPPVQTSTATIGLIGVSQSPANDFQSFKDISVLPILQSLERVLAKSDCTTIFFDQFRTDRPQISVEDAILALLADHVDGLVVIDLQNDPCAGATITSLLPHLPIPLVYVSAGASIHQCLHVCHENRSGGYIAAEHLLRQGIEQLVFFTPYNLDWAKDRYVGAQAAIKHAGMPAEALLWRPLDLPVSSKIDAELAYEVAGAALKEGPSGLLGPEPAHPFGIIAANDFAAYGFIRAASEVGLTPGVDFAIVGFDDAPPSRAMGLTTLRRPLEAMGEEAACLIGRALADRALDVEVRLRMHLVPRASTQLRSATNLTMRA